MALLHSRSVLLVSSLAFGVACGDLPFDGGAQIAPVNDLEVTSQALDGGSGLLPSFNVGGTSWASLTPLPELDLLISHPIAVSSTSFTPHADSRFLMDGATYEIDSDRQIVFGDRAFDKLVALLPPRTVVRDEVAHIPGKKPANLKAVAILIAEAKKRGTEKKTSDFLKAQHGTDFGLIPPRFVKRTWVTGYGGYAYLAVSGGKGIPAGEGVSRVGKSWSAAYKAGHPIGRPRLKTWSAFLRGWVNTLADRERYVRLKTRELSGDWVKAERAYEAEEQALRKEAKEFNLAAGVLGIRPENNNRHEFFGPNGEVSMRIEEGPNNLRIVTRDQTLNGMLETRRQQFDAELRNLQRQSQRRAWVWAMSGWRDEGLSGVHTLMIELEFEFNERLLSYFNDVNNTLREHGYPQVRNPYEI
jgi:hypothetical protein